MASYYIARDGKQTGPFEEAEILRRIEEGIFTSNDLCWREGMADWRPIATVLSVVTQKLSPPPIPAMPIHGAGQAAPLFLHISVARLILMSIVSFSLYEAYWIYRNWRYVKERDNLTIRPFWRGVFGIFYCHSLLRRIHEDKEARSVQVPSFSPNGLATGWVVLIIIASVLSGAPGIAAGIVIVAAFIPSFLCLVPVQNYVNSVTERASPGQPYYHWSSGHIVCLVIGIIIWAFHWALQWSLQFGPCDK
jgi:hypothetical protein